MKIQLTFDQTSRPDRILLQALAIGSGVVTIAVTLAIVYAWLWFVAFAINYLGFVAGSALVVLSFVVLARLGYVNREPLIGFFQPWDSGQWIVVEEQSSHFWQRSFKGEVANG